ncbi:MAG: hypothetical protein HC895_21410 [Leptolyngbyaceae cyanobacterium SM1_3_5]|nr:hypothetical protein [Leptolyngbyaceae cyanobacterium SM1_3_5]
MAADACRLDFVIDALECACDASSWARYQSMAIECGWILPQRQIAWVCDRPCKLSFDNQGRLHADGEPAIEYRDGFKIYAYQGAKLPEKYGKHPVKEWQIDWVRKEKNAQIQQALIRGIGYHTVLETRLARRLDSWEGYALFEIALGGSAQSLYVLRMCGVPAEFDIIRELPLRV